MFMCVNVCFEGVCVLVRWEVSVVVRLCVYVDVCECVRGGECLY